MWPTDLRLGERNVCANLCFRPHRVEGRCVKCGEDELDAAALALAAGEFGALDPGDEDGEELPVVECDESDGVCVWFCS